MEMLMLMLWVVVDSRGGVSGGFVELDWREWVGEMMHVCLFAECKEIKEKLCA